MLVDASLTTLPVFSSFAHIKPYFRDLGEIQHENSMKRLKTLIMRYEALCFIIENDEERKQKTLAQNLYDNKDERDSSWNIYI